MNPNPHLDELVETSHQQIVGLLNGTSTPVVAYFGHSIDAPTRRYLAHGYWPEQRDRALALGQAATWEMTVGGTLAAVERYGVVWTHIVTVKAQLDFADETGLTWRRLQDAAILDPMETEALLGFIFDIDSGFEVAVTRIAQHGSHYHVAETHRYDTSRVIDPIPGLIIMRTIAENAPVKEYK